MKHARAFRHAACYTGLAASLLLCLWGCASMGKPAGAGFASVEIGGHTPAEVSSTAIKVFTDDGYDSIPSKDGLVFERIGSEWDQAAYGSNLAGSDPVLDRVKAQVVDLGGGVCRLQCTAYVVQNSGGTFEKEVRLHLPRSGPYRALLDQVVQKLTEVHMAKP